MTPGVVVAEATPFLRLAVRNALVADGIPVAAEAATAQEMLQVVTGLQPDVVLLGAELDPDMDTVRRIVQVAPGVSVIVLADESSQEAVLGAVRAGACGFVPKDTAPERLPAIVRGSLAGEAAIPRRLVRGLLDQIRLDVPRLARDRGLSQREHDVMELLAAGADDGAVADRLGIVEVTVRRHVASAARKLGVEDRSQALVAYRATVDPLSSQLPAA